MARLIFILGQPGTGKSSSLRNFKKDELAYITVTGKELPFKTDIKPAPAKSMAEVKQMVVASKKPVVVIDDTNYLFTKEIFGASESDNKDKFGLFDRISKDFYSIMMAIMSKDTDQNFYLMGHIEENDSTRVMLKTLGQATRKNNNPEGWTNIVLESAVEIDGEFVFRVKTDGKGVKSPIGMFSSETVPNDLKEINKEINEYYKASK